MAVVRGQEPVLRFIRKLAVREHNTGLSDCDLLQCFVKQGDQEAFAALVRRHGPMVLRVCVQVVNNDHDAEDAFQATFVVLRRRASSIKNQQSIGSWLFGVANHVATNLRRNLVRRRSHENKVGATSANDTLSVVTLREAQAILHQELARLPEKYRAPLVLCSLEGQTRDEAAHQLGWSVGTFKRRLEQARKRLRGRLACRGLTLSGAFVTSVFCDQMASAAVPTGLLNSTIKAATTVAAKGAAASVLSAKVAALTEGMVKSMFMTKLKVAAIVLMAAALIGSGTGAFMQAGLGKTQSDQAKLPAKAPKSDRNVRPEVERAAAEDQPAVQVAKAEQDRVFELMHTRQVRLFDLMHAGQPDKAKPGGTWKEIRSLRWQNLGGLAFAPEGNILVAAGSVNSGSLIASERDAKVTVWDRETGKEIRSFKDEGPILRRSFMLGFALSRDGKKLALGGEDGCVRVWNLDDGQEIGMFNPHGANVRSLAFSPDGKMLATASWDKTVKLWDLSFFPFQEKATLRGHTDMLHTVAFSRDGKILASGSSDGTVRLWDVATGQEKACLRHGRFVRVAAFSPTDAKLLATGSNGTMKLWDVETQKERATCQYGGMEGLGLAFAPDGKTVATANSETMDNKLEGVVTLWDVATGKQREVIKGQTGLISAISFSGDGKYLAISADASPREGTDIVGPLDEGTIKVWKLEKQESKPEVKLQEIPLDRIEFIPADKVQRLPADVFIPIPADKVQLIPVPSDVIIPADKVGKPARQSPVSEPKSNAGQPVTKQTPGGAAAKGADHRSPAFEQLHGQWKIVAYENRGRDWTESAKGKVFVFCDKDLFIYDKSGEPFAPTSIQRYRLKLNPTTTPKCIDAKLVFDREDFLALNGREGASREGIYELKDGILRICLNALDLKERPQRLATREEGPEVVMYTLEREKSED